MQKNDLMERISILGQAYSNDGWNGYDARALDESARANAMRIAPALIEAYAGKPIDVFPLPDGNIQFEVDCDGSCTEFEVSPCLVEVTHLDVDGKILDEDTYTVDKFIEACRGSVWYVQ